MLQMNSARGLQDFVSLSDTHFFLGRFLNRTARSAEMSIPRDTTPGEVSSIGETRLENLEDKGDRGWFRIDHDGDVAVGISLFGYQYHPDAYSSDLANPDLWLYDQDGAVIAEDDVGDVTVEGKAGNGDDLLRVAEIGDWSAQTDSFVFAPSADPAVLAAEAPQDTIPGDNTTTESVLLNRSYVNGALEFEGDRDWFSVDVPALTSVSFTIYGAEHTADNGLTALENVLVNVYDSEGTLVASDNVADGSVAAQPRFNAWSAGTYYVEVAGVNDAEVGEYQVTAWGTLREYQGELSAGDRIFGTTEDYFSNDVYAIRLTEGESVWINLTGRDHDSTNGIGALADPALTLYDGDAQFIAETDERAFLGDIGRLGASTVLTATEAGTYYIQVGNALSQEYGDYVLTVLDASDLSADMAVPSDVPML